MKNVEFLRGSCMDRLGDLEAESVQMVVTSPPYFGLRDYGVKGQMGLETSPAEYIAALVKVFKGLGRVLRNDGTIWLNLGDSYNSGGSGGLGGSTLGGGQDNQKHSNRHGRKRVVGAKHKDLLGIPWRVALALQADGWYLRQDIIWAKPNPMPESVTDRCTRSHEYIFLLTKQPRYYFDHKAIQVPASASFAKDPRHKTGSTKHNDKQGYEAARAQNPKGPHRLFGRGGKSAFRGQGHMREGAGPANRQGRDMKDVGVGLMANKRDVWTVTTKPFKGAHFATFPPDLIEPCILAGSKPGDLVLDPFGGAGTTGLVASRLGRRAVLIELNPKYIALAKARIKADKRKTLLGCLESTRASRQCLARRSSTSKARPT